MKRQLLLFMMFLNFCCFIYVATLCYFNQFALDDFCLYEAYLKKGFNSAITIWWKDQNGRYLPLYFCNLVFILYNKTGTLFFSSFALYALFIFATKKLLQSILSYFSMQFTKLQILNFALFITHIILFNNFKFNTLFWVTGQWMYIGGIAFFFLGLSFWNKEKLNFLNWITIIFSFWFAGCSAENYALSFITITLAILYFIKKTNNLSIKVGCIVLIISFISLLISPGSQHRLADNIGNNSSLMDQVYFFLKIYPSRMLQLLGLTSIVHLPLGLAFIYIFKLILNNYNSSFSISIGNFIKKYKLFLLLFIVILIIENTAPVVFAMGQIGDQRTLSFTNVLFLLLYFILFYSVINPKNEYKYMVFGQFIIILWSLGIVYKSIKEFPLLVQYKASQAEIRQRIAKPLAKEFYYKNQEQLYSPTVSNLIINYLINNYLPSKKSFIKALTNEPLWINRVENIDQKTFTDCMCGALQAKVIVGTVKE